MSRRTTKDKGDPNVVFDEDNPEWTEEDFRRAQPAYLVMPEILDAFPKTRRGPQKSPTKTAVSIRLSDDVLSYFKSGGHGWQTRIDETLRAAVRNAAGFGEQPQTKLKAK